MNDDDDEDTYLGAVVRWNPYVDSLLTRLMAASVLGDFRHVPEEKEPEDPAIEPKSANEIVTFDLVPLTDEELVKARADGRIALPNY